MWVGQIQQFRPYIKKSMVYSFIPKEIHYVCLWQSIDRTTFLRLGKFCFDTFTAFKMKVE